VSEANDLAVLSARYDVLIARQRPGDAVNLLKGQAAYHQDQPLYWAMLGNAFNLEEKYVEAEHAARRTVELIPHNIAAQSILLQALIGQRRSEESLDLAQFVIAQFPEESDGHYWLSRALILRPKERQDFIAAYEAARRALSLKADEWTFTQAAQTAALIEKDQEARELLAAGLAQYPHSRELVLLSGSIRGAEEIVGQRQALVGGILHTSPSDVRAEADLASGPVRWVRFHLQYLWYHLLAFTFCAVVPLPESGLMVIALLGGGFHTALIIASYRQLDDVLPKGYLREQLTTAGRARNSAAAFVTAGLLILAGTVLDPLRSAPFDWVGDVLLVLASGILAAGLLSADRTISRLGASSHPEDHQAEPYRSFRFGDNASSYREYWLAALTGMITVTIAAATGGNPTGGAGMLSVGILWSVKTLDLIHLSRAVPGGENPWVEWSIHRQGQEARLKSDLQARLLGVRFILLLLIVCCVTCTLGVIMLTGGFAGVA
jgi:tetratricopeptide (TPR) repeat protein